MRAIAAFQAKLNAGPFDQYSHTHPHPHTHAHKYAHTHTHFAHISVSIEHVFMYAPDFETSSPSTSSSLIVPEL
jgi:hypothetical protein